MSRQSYAVALHLALLVAALLPIAASQPHEQKALFARAGSTSESTSSLKRPEGLDHALLGKGCSFCVQFNFQANFDKLAQAISGVASDIADVEKTLDKMAQNFTKGMEDIADGIKDLAKSVEELGKDMLFHIVAMRGFLNEVKAEIDLGILVTELQTSIARIENRQGLLEPLMHDKSAMTPDEIQNLVAAILDINAGSDIDTQIIHDVMTGSGGVVPGVQPALQVYMKQGYRLDQLAKVYGALFIYQIHGYAQLYWAYMNKRPNIELKQYNQTSDVQVQRLVQQWEQFAAPVMWGCYWDDGFKCPARQECPTEMRTLTGFTCNYADAPLTVDATTSVSAFTFGAASTDSSLMIHRDVLTGTCAVGVKDCSGAMPAAVPIVATGGATVTNFTCATTVSAVLSADGVFSVPGVGVIQNLSASNHSKYALFLNESGQIAIIGDDLLPLWTWPTTSLPNPTSGPCATSFAKRAMAPITYDQCQCITTARWRKVGSASPNVTAASCSRRCQAFGTEYVGSAPRANGECWCATPDAMKEQLLNKDQDCNANCTFCPGNPTSTCGQSNTVAIYNWGSVETFSEMATLI